ncbi:LysR substrate-binding domain-containing protein [Shewanella sp. NIFS-20-20]|uniref:LysR substrate-binding domain-containing protein n=1 Tax=Shewanella sp. NIFS-20-20 TaxID=2853806 RepID=UPI001C45F3D2|nr:LysR substrate-binding domain-containing protein [Shewanella sp. NIFS-20-20]MBV7317025.1 LysR family transcriptional regulator [Shewanella sp. NIFS-20-20]
MVNWDGINEFVAVSESESFTKAGQRLNISTAQVSRQISALESRLATKLFHRTTRKVTMTEVGQVFYQHCRQILDNLDEAERVISNLQLSPRGRLKITAPVTYGEKTIAPLINDFLSKYPDLEVNMILTNQKLDVINDGFDVAIRLGQLENSNLMAARLSSRQQYICASSHYLSVFGTPHSIAELEQHNCLLGTIDFWRLDEQGKTRNIKVRGNLRCNSGHALVDAAIKGIGIIQLPDYYVLPYIEQGLLVPILEQHRSEDEGIWALYPQNRHLSPKIRLLLDYLKLVLNKA